VLKIHLSTEVSEALRENLYCNEARVSFSIQLTGQEMEFMSPEGLRLDGRRPFEASREILSAHAAYR
jgi:hypothetical protein